MSFYTQVIQRSKVFHSASRVSDLSLLEPTFRRKVEAIVSDAHAHGVMFLVYETYRSAERQEALYRQGATKLQHVGVHHYGEAADLVKSVGGQPSWDGDFSLLGHLAHVHGLISGLDWGTPHQHHSFIDAVHVQRVAIKDQARLFDGTWYPDAHYDPYAAAA